ncbi:hypothetical protein BBK36DRAFT_1138878 [Trichoderma citrinoviride]|uniref:Uncharacterized protein n=1 Tax=Trichoderma citrinoviride TaxID=58853 RepID=A0A2T4BHK5_9HYPO|nr:hypothetical protein BBK36DRAFT_1138878 [Trichoderma citrinoviride]PTB68780.1 hypothetical protein BBK36DRAFT_1138878 [Trichoderma citrinoviride]
MTWTFMLGVGQSTSGPLAVRALRTQAGDLRRLIITEADVEGRDCHGSGMQKYKYRHQPEHMQFTEHIFFTRRTTEGLSILPSLNGLQPPVPNVCRGCANVGLGRYSEGASYCPRCLMQSGR